MIFEARRRAGISQAELARRSGVPRSVVNAYERGRREPGVDALERLLDAVGCSLRIADAIRYPDEQAAARDLEELLGLADAIPVHVPRRPLTFPSLARR